MSKNIEALRRWIEGGVMSSGAEDDAALVEVVRLLAERTGADADALMCVLYHLVDGEPTDKAEARALVKVYDFLSASVTPLPTVNGYTMNETES